MLTARNLTSRVMSRRRKPPEVSVDRWKGFGAWIREQRRRADKKQIGVAKQVGIDPVHLSRIENGKSGISRETAIALARVYGIDETEVLNRAGFYDPDRLDVYPHTQLTTRLLFQFFALPESNQQDALAIIDLLWRLHGKPHNDDTQTVENSSDPIPHNSTGEATPQPADGDTLMKDQTQEMPIQDMTDRFMKRNSPKQDPPLFIKEITKGEKKDLDMFDDAIEEDLTKNE